MERKVRGGKKEKGAGGREKEGGREGRERERWEVKMGEGNGATCICP